MKSLIVLSLLALSACTKHPDAPAPQVQPVNGPTQPPPPQPPPVTNCLGSTVLYQLPGNPLINDLSSRSFVIPGFEVSCGDSLRVYMRRPNIQLEPWTEYFNVDNGASYYSINNQTVTIYNKTGIVLEAYIEAILK